MTLFPENMNEANERFLFLLVWSKKEVWAYYNRIENSAKHNLGIHHTQGHLKEKQTARVGCYKVYKKNYCNVPKFPLFNKP